MNNKLLSCILAASGVLAVMAGCADDTEPLPSYQENLVCLHTDASGVIGEMVIDDGPVYRVSNVKGGLRPDTTYRAMALYTHEEGADVVWLTDYAALLAPAARKYRNNVVRDPLSVVACWKSGGYVNFRLQVKGSNGKTHYFGFHEAEVRENGAGGKTVCIQLVHNQNNDPLYYGRETYLCLPLADYQKTYSAPTDSIEVSAVTFNGDCIRRFPLGK